MAIKIPLTLLMLCSCLLLTSCSSNSVTTEQHQKALYNLAEMHQRTADIYRNQNNDYMAHYYVDESRRYYHNSFATGCDITQEIVSTALGTDTCKYK